MYLPDQVEGRPQYASSVFHLGMDLGSTTAKLVVTDHRGAIRFSAYSRHQVEVRATLLDLLRQAAGTCGTLAGAPLLPVFTGSAGMGLAEKTGIGFIQEVVAQSQGVDRRYPDCRMLVDIGGEDCKMIFFDRNRGPDMRMNGNCAGGTGAFIDQMASLIGLSPADLDDLARQSGADHPIASRCGVFAKTDVQNLINTGVGRDDIARAIFRAVACQAVTSLARGRAITGPVLMTGGPLHFFSTLRADLLDALSLPDTAGILPAEALIFSAYGAALSVDRKQTEPCTLDTLIGLLEKSTQKSAQAAPLAPLFDSPGEFAAWQRQKSRHDLTVVAPEQATGSDLYLGVDAGSTTTKIVAIDDRGRLLFRHYASNQGDPVGSVAAGLQRLAATLGACPANFTVRRSVVTGYGEDLIRAAFGLDGGVVETLAHHRAARELDPRVSFILDIGGQDMKAIFVRDGLVHDIEVNESCSSGCGSFLEAFAESLGYDPETFGALACTAGHPVDLGSRCTVFMNSCVKQALRQGNDTADVAAGLAYSVILNCLHKVLRISDPAALGDCVIAQGGTFKNPAVLRAFEKLLGIEVIRPTIAEYMGAYGAALLAREEAATAEPGPALPVTCFLDPSRETRTSRATCRGCSNHCRVRTLQFSGGGKYHTGNRCERIFSNRGRPLEPGRNLFSERLALLASYPRIGKVAEGPVVGIPMVLNTYENYPFWSTFFTALGWRVVRSEITGPSLIRESAATVMSDNVCYPAKLAHAHIFELIDRRVERIFYPRVVYEESLFDDCANHYNCPVVSGYPDVIDCAVDPSGQGIPLDSPIINFSDRRLLKNGCADYIRSFGLDNERFERAFALAVEAQKGFRREVARLGREVIDRARAARQPMIVLGGRPYHGDPSINHAIPDMIAAMGIHVLTEDSLPLAGQGPGEPLQVVDQWEYSNRLYRAARWTSAEPLAQFIQLNSFGCGPDAVIIDELKAILGACGKPPVVLKIDEITSIGSARLRVRSLVEAKMYAKAQWAVQPRPKLPLYVRKDRRRTLLVPEFSPFYSLFAQAALTAMGQRVEILPSPDRESVSLGLKFANNDICYPAIITVGDVIKALRSGRYDPGAVAVAFTETGGQCRATNYLSLIKKALLNAGYRDIPVVSVSLSSRSMNHQPGFSISRTRLTSLILSSLLVVDQLIRMYHATAVRETESGGALAILKRHLDRARNQVGGWTLQRRTELLEEAIDDFNHIATTGRLYPKAGLVGEIYLKYNPFGNSTIVERLMKGGIEVVVPPLITFFLQSLVNVPFNHANHIVRAGALERRLVDGLQRFVNGRIEQVNELMTKFRHRLDPIVLPELLAAKAGRILSLANQAGEGWLLPGEIVAMAESGIRNIISIQPFGCIANHVVAKGIGSRVSRLFPDLNFLNMDMDAGTSDVNFQNRLELFIHAAQTGEPRETAPA